VECAGSGREQAMCADGRGRVGREMTKSGRWETEHVAGEGDRAGWTHKVPRARAHLHLERLVSRSDRER
jgi:hypothetical protein